MGGQNRGRELKSCGRCTEQQRLRGGGGVDFVSKRSRAVTKGNSKMKVRVKFTKTMEGRVEKNWGLQ